LNDAKPHLNQTSTSPLYIYETNSNVVKYLELVTHFYDYYYHCLVDQNRRYLFCQSILNAKNRPIRPPYVYRAFSPETGPYKHRIHPNITPYVMVSFNKSSTHKGAQGFQSTGKEDAPSQSEEMSGHLSHPDIEVDTDVRFESEHARMKKTAKIRV
jgi:hypothetical protein